MTSTCPEPYCNLTFPTWPELYEHRRQSHVYAQAYICTICQRAWDILTTLSEHMRFNKGRGGHPDMPVSCCGQEFKTWTLLVKHQKAQMGVQDIAQSVGTVTSRFFLFYGFKTWSCSGCKAIVTTEQTKTHDC